MKHLSRIILFLLMSLSAVTAMTQAKKGLPVHLRDRWSTSTKSVREIPFEASLARSKVLIIHFKCDAEVTLEVKGTDGKTVYANMVCSVIGDEVIVNLSNALSGNYKLFISGQDISLEGDFCLD